MLLVSRYVALKHEFPTEVPPELDDRRAPIQFARWLVLNGLLSDWPTSPEEMAGEAVVDEGRSSRHALVG